MFFFMSTTGQFISLTNQKIDKPGKSGPKNIFSGFPLLKDYKLSWKLYIIWTWNSTCRYNRKSNKVHIPVN